MVTKNLKIQYKAMRDLGFVAHSALYYARAALWAVDRVHAWTVQPDAEAPRDLLDPTCYTEREISRMTAWCIGVRVTTATAPACPCCGRDDVATVWEHLGGILASGPELSAEDEALYVAELTGELYAQYRGVERIGP